MGYFSCADTAPDFMGGIKIVACPARCTTPVVSFWYSRAALILSRSVQCISSRGTPRNRRTPPGCSVSAFALKYATASSNNDRSERVIPGITELGTLRVYRWREVGTGQRRDCLDVRLRGRRRRELERELVEHRDLPVDVGHLLDGLDRDQVRL